MGFCETNVHSAISSSLTVFKACGFWRPDGLDKRKKRAYDFYTFFSFMFLSGTYLIIQVVDLFMVWGDIQLMTETAFLLFTNVAQASKISSLVFYRRTIGEIIGDANEYLGAAEGESREIVKRGNRVTSRLQVLYLSFTMITVAGWVGSAQKNQLPLRAWYPYDTAKSPAYELTYAHQVIALVIAAYLNVSKDVFITTLIGQCHCQLRLLGLEMKTFCDDLVPNEKGILPREQEAMACYRLQVLARQHQLILRSADLLQTCFKVPLFAQFCVSLVIICVSALELAAAKENWIRLISMSTYFFNMMLEIFLYCYHGNQLSEESIELADAAYQCPWYACSRRFRSALLIVMVRTRRVPRLTAGGITTLSLPTFMSIVKTSYSLFTVLQQAGDN